MCQVPIEVEHRRSRPVHLAGLTVGDVLRAVKVLKLLGSLREFRGSGNAVANTEYGSWQES